VLRRRVDIAASWAAAKQTFAAVVVERDWLRGELAQTRKSLEETRAALSSLQAAVLARHKAEAELANLYRQREIARAKATERDITQPLN